MRSTLFARAGSAVCALALAMASGCTAAVKNDAASSYLVVDALLAASGAKPDTFGGSLASDVLTYVKKDLGGGQQVLVPTVFEDLGQVALHLAMKDPGTTSAPTAPSNANFITLTQYHLKFIRSDGRNTPGVDVPFPFSTIAEITFYGRDQAGHDVNTTARISVNFADWGDPS